MGLLFFFSDFTSAVLSDSFSGTLLASVPIAGPAASGTKAGVVDVSAGVVAAGVSAGAVVVAEAVVAAVTPAVSSDCGVLFSSSGFFGLSIFNSGIVLSSI